VRVVRNGTGGEEGAEVGQFGLVDVGFGWSGDSGPFGGGMGWSARGVKVAV
jgi:hypothetical protein